MKHWFSGILWKNSFFFSKNHILWIQPWLYYAPTMPTLYWLTWLFASLYSCSWGPWQKVNSSEIEMFCSMNEWYNWSHEIGPLKYNRTLTRKSSSTICLVINSLQVYTETYAHCNLWYGGIVARPCVVIKALNLSMPRNYRRYNYSLC